MAYDISELDIKDDSNQERLRVSNILKTLENKIESQESLTEHEKNFYCTFLKTQDDGYSKIKECEYCNNFTFSLIFLSYFHDLTGNGEYYKTNNQSTYIPSKEEVENDITFLKSISDTWLGVIQKTNHTEELLQQISKEARNDLKKLDDNNTGKLKAILYSKYLYCYSKKKLEVFEEEGLTLILNEKNIEITEYSIVHILNRHFSKIMKENSDKSFHNQNFHPEFLNIQLIDIFKKIDESKYLEKSTINKIAFHYKNVDYQIWVNERQKQISGIKGNIRYHRLESLYPIENQNDISKLNQNYTVNKINDDLSVWVKNIDS